MCVYTYMYKYVYEHTKNRVYGQYCYNALFPLKKVLVKIKKLRKKKVTDN